MTRALLTLNNKVVRDKAIKWVNQAPDGTRLEFKAPRRSVAQNSLLWALLTDVATQMEHFGRKYAPTEWKILFLHACGREIRMMPSLDGKTFVPWGQSSSDLSKEEMTNLIEFIYAWGANNGMDFK